MLKSTENAQGILISFEGLDNCGKTTQVERLRTWLESSGHSVRVFREPGSTAFGESARELLLHRKESHMAPMTQNLLFLASLAQGWEENVIPALQAGNCVILDRFTDSSLAYQCYGSGIDLKFLKSAHRAICGERSPDATFLLDISVGVMRQRQNQPADKIESSPDVFHEAVRGGFMELAAKDARRFRVINGTMPAEAVELVIRGRVVELLHKGGRYG